MKRILSYFLCMGLIVLHACKPEPESKPEPYLSVSPESLAFPQEGGSLTVRISANNAWTARVSGSGYSLSASSGTGDTSLTVTAAAASATDLSSGTLTVSSGGLTASVQLTQEAKSAILVGDSAIIPAEGGSFEVDVQYNTDFTVEVEAAAQSWITFVKTKALQNGKLEFMFAANENTEPRTGKVTVKDKSGKVSPITITFIQEEKKVIHVGETTTIPAEGGSYEVDVQYNTDFTVEVETAAQSWITFVKTKALQSGKLEFQFAANESTDPRQGTVTVKDNSGKVSTITLTFIQEEKKVINVGETTTIPAEGGSFEVDIQYNTDFTVEVETSAQSWITFVKTKALQNGKLEFMFAANENRESRQGTVTVKDNSGKVSPITLLFIQEAKILVTAVTLDVESAVIAVGETLTLTATVAPENASDMTVTWSSDNNEVAAVDGSGIVTAIKVGTAIITAMAGDKTAACTVTVIDREEEAIKAALMKFYDALDGPNWKIAGKWDLSLPLNEWEGVRWNKQTDEFELLFNGNFGLKGEFPDCFDELPSLTYFLVQNEPGVTGTLPSSFGKLRNLKILTVNFTSMTSFPDIFENVPLVSALVSGNTLMTGSLPETLGSSPYLDDLYIGGNAFTGTVPDSWARLGTKLDIQEESLDGRVPDSFVTAADADYLINMYLIMSVWRTSPLMVGDYDIPAYWPRRDIKDLVTGETIPYKEIVSRNKATVLLNWATWCPFSKVLMPVLKKMYEKYHADGLEIIAAFNADSPSEDSGKPLKDVLLERNYEQWYNFNLWNFSSTEWSIWCSSTPAAIVVDNKGNIMTSSRTNVNDYARNRFGHVASANLIPILEDIFGPLEDEEEYFSTDYSMDGEVMTLQTASAGKGINIVFMGDAYTDRDMEPGGLYETLMRESMQELFAIEPYKTFRDRFNVYAVKVVSKDGKTGDGYSTALGSVATYGSISTGNIDKCYEYALKVPGIKDDRNLLVGVLVNSVSGRGITAMSESRQSGVAFYGSSNNQREAFGNTLRHEAGGHGFAFLDDEYTTMSGEAPGEYVDFRSTMYQKYGWYSNVDFTDDPAKVKWSAFLFDGRYKDEVGIFEGGSLYSKGVYRPSENSMMRDNYEYYNAPSRWAIYQRIMELSGEDYSFGKFLEYDAVNRGSAAAAVARPPLKAAQNIPPSTPPVVVP